MTCFVLVQHYDYLRFVFPNSFFLLISSRHSQPLAVLVLVCFAMLTFLQTSFKRGVLTDIKTAIRSSNKPHLEVIKVRQANENEAIERCLRGKSITRNSRSQIFLSTITYMLYE